MIKFRKSSLYYALIFLYCFADLKFFYFIDIVKFTFLGISYTDMLFILNVSLFLYEFIFNQKGVLKINFPIYLIIISICLACTSAYAGYLTYGQAFFSGLVAQRHWISSTLVIYTIYNWLIGEKITKEGLVKLISIVVVFYMIVMIAQYLLYNKVVFTYVTQTERYGETRLYFDISYLVFISGFAIEAILERKKKAKPIIFVLVILVCIAFITKGRMATLSLCLGMMCSLLISKDGSVKKKLEMICFVLVCLLIFINSNMGKDIFNTVLGTTSENNTLAIRDDGRVYYLRMISSSTNSCLIGCGTANIHNKTAMKISSPYWKTYSTARFYLTDQGIIYGLYNYGILGIVVYLILIIWSFKSAWRLYKREGRTAYLQYLIVQLISCVTLVPDYFESSFLFPMYIILLNIENNRIKYEKQVNE